jgi:hypothetical protein
MYLGGSHGLDGWMLPVGAALVALGVTLVGASLWVLRKRGVDRRASLDPSAQPGSEESEVRDSVPAGLRPGEIESLDRQIAALERRFEELRDRLGDPERFGTRSGAAAPCFAADPRGTSSEVRELAARAFEGR